MEIGKYKAKTCKEACVWLQGRAGALTASGVRKKLSDALLSLRKISRLNVDNTQYCLFYFLLEQT